MNSTSLNSDLEQIQTASAYTFSAQPLDSLGAVEYTLATVVLDKSGSLGGYERDLEKALSEVVLACKKSPRADNLMIRNVAFDDNVTEINGFKLLGGINSNDFTNTIRCYGSTALYDAVFTSIEATLAYGKSLTDQGFLTNALIVVATDGEDNRSKYTPAQIKKLNDDASKNESLESLTVILVAIGDKALMRRLDIFRQEAGVTQFIEFGDITPQKLAKLAGFVSKSISSTSQSLGSGGPSQPLTF